MRKPNITDLILWLIAPAVVFAFLAQRPPTRPHLNQHQEASQVSSAVSIISPTARWESARALTDPLRRLEASWAVIDALTLKEIAELFHEAMKTQDHELIAALGGAWIREDPADFIASLADTPIRDWDPLFLKPLMTTAYLKYAELDSAKALKAYQGMDHQSRLVLSSAVGSPLVLRYLSDDPARVAALEESSLSLFANGTPSHFHGDVRELAQALANLPPSKNRTAFLIFLRQSILSDPSPEAAQARFSDWWQTLPEDLQIEALPWELDPEFLARPGLRQRLAEEAMGDDVHSISTYMHHYGAAWAEENPQEALEWVFERFEGRSLSGPPHPQESSLWSGSISFNIRFDEPLGKNANTLTTSLKAPISAIARQDPQRAIAHLAEIDHLYIRSQLYPVIAKAWAETDREAALRWSESLPGKWARDQSRSSITGQWDSGFFRLP